MYENVVIGSLLILTKQNTRTQKLMRFDNSLILKKAKFTGQIKKLQYLAGYTIPNTTVNHN